MDDTLNKLFALAIHPTTGQNEALSALGSIRRKAKGADVRIVRGDLVDQRSGGIKWSALYLLENEECESLRGQLKALRAELSEFRSVESVLASKLARRDERIRALEAAKREIEQSARHDAQLKNRFRELFETVMETEREPEPTPAPDAFGSKHRDHNGHDQKRSAADLAARLKQLCSENRSPGGRVNLVFESAELIRELRNREWTLREIAALGPSQGSIINVCKHGHLKCQ